MSTTVSGPELSRADVRARRLAVVMVVTPAAGFLIAVLFAFRYGISALDLSLAGVMYVVTALGVEVGMHRFFSHRSFSSGPAMTAWWAITGCAAAQGPTLFWVATHRRHHAFADRDGDPHSPRPRGEGRWAVLRGLWHGHAGWLFQPRAKDWNKYVPDLMADRLVMRIDRYYLVWVVAGLALPAAAGGVLDGWRGATGGLLWGGFARVFLLDQVTWAVNSIGHTLGSRPQRTGDNSRNVVPLVPVSLGGSWHNNHHARPSLAHNRRSRWQLDPSGFAIRLLDLAGLVTDVRYGYREAPASRERKK